MHDAGDRGQLIAAARLFLDAAFSTLAEEHVIPTPRFHPFIRVGRDYSGPTLSGLQEFKELEELLRCQFPEKFKDPLRHKTPQFPNSYIFSLLEASVRRCADDTFQLNAGTYGSGVPGVAQSIDEFVQALESADYGVSVVRAMSHVTTATGEPLTVAGIEIVPESSSAPARDFFLDECRQRIPGSGGAFHRERPFVFALPHAVLAASSYGDARADEVASDLSGRIDQFLLAMRLLTGATARTHFEVSGPTTMVAHFNAHLVLSDGASFMPRLRRTLRVEPSHERAVQGLLSLLSGLPIRDGLAQSQLGTAISRFSAAFSQDSLLALVDLSTALEAVLIDEKDGNDGVSARLRARAATLLASETDSAQDIYEDLRHLYELRSSFVHGGSLSAVKLRSRVHKISTVSASDAYGISALRAVDRMRDLVRRAILARVCLASGPTPPWPFSPSKGMDASFSDDAVRNRMRQGWLLTLSGFEAAWAAGPLAAPVDVLKTDYGPESDAD